eukprot:scaffold338458_cov17-Prasinocladus_malaysianus.AAC.2
MGPFGKMICFGKEHLLTRRCSPPAGDKPMHVLDCYQHPATAVIIAQKVPSAQRAGFMRSSGTAQTMTSSWPQPNASIHQQVGPYSAMNELCWPISIVVPADQHSGSASVRCY